MEVPYNYLPYEFADTDNIFVDWKELINSTDFTLGKYVKNFENKFAKFLGVKHCISTNNGTDAIILALKALGIKKGDEVITVANTFYATVGAIVAVGATPVLVDCDSQFQICVDKIQKAIGPKTKAILPVHWAGSSPNMNLILDICKKNKLFLVEDACMGIGASINKKNAGTFGNVNAFSMHPLKSLNVMGDGGMVVTNNSSLASWMEKYRNHGMIDRDHIEFWGVNMRLQPLQAIVASHRLDALTNTLSRRRHNAKILDEGLKPLVDKGIVALPKRLDGYLETFALYMGLFRKRDKLVQYLENNKIEVKIHYPVPLHLQKAAEKNCVFDKTDLKNVEYQSKHLITIPVHQYLTETQLSYTIDCIIKFYSDD